MRYSSWRLVPIQGLAANGSLLEEERVFKQMLPRRHHVEHSAGRTEPLELLDRRLHVLP